jgi:hypothetical protein
LEDRGRKLEVEATAPDVGGWTLEGGGDRRFEERGRKCKVRMLDNERLWDSIGPQASNLKPRAAEEV